VAGREVVSVEDAGPAPTTAADLMAALRASVERARAARAETEAPAKTPRKRTTPRKAATTNATARTRAHTQPAPKKAGARRAPTRKPKSGSEL
jgi:DNA end-binding protein Ku